MFEVGIALGIRRLFESNVRDGGSGWNHRENVVFLADHDFQKVGTFVFHHFFEGSIQLLSLVNFAG
ncbi:MAG: hypothetical protein ACI814_002864, partial [Mariniblastus sp.]